MWYDTFKWIKAIYLVPNFCKNMMFPATYFTIIWHFKCWHHWHPRWTSVDKIIEVSKHAFNQKKSSVYICDAVVNCWVIIGDILFILGYYFQSRIKRGWNYIGFKGKLRGTKEIFEIQTKDNQKRNFKGRYCQRFQNVAVGIYLFFRRILRTNTDAQVLKKGSTSYLEWSIFIQVQRFWII